MYGGCHFCYLHVLGELLGKIHPIYGPKDFLGAVLRTRDPSYISSPVSMGERVELLKEEEEDNICEESLVGIINVKSLFTLVSYSQNCFLTSFSVSKTTNCTYVTAIFQMMCSLNKAHSRSGLWGVVLNPVYTVQL